MVTRFALRVTCFLLHATCAMLFCAVVGLAQDPAIGAWSQQAELTASDGAAYDIFGISVSVSGNMAVVGAQSHTVGSNMYQGAAYVFVRNGGTWSQQAELIASDGAARDLFGASVAINGSTAVVGAPFHAVGSNQDQGAAYVFVKSGGTWTQQAELTASDGAASDHFGNSVAVDGGTVVVGAYVRNVGLNSQQGAAYVFVESSGTWSQQAELTASDGAAGDIFGLSVAVRGTTAAVGAPYHTVGSNTKQGAAYVFVRNGGTWSQQAELIASDGTKYDYFGNAVAVSGSKAVVGAPNHPTFGTAVNAGPGAAYVFVEIEGMWGQQAELTASDGAAGDGFGASVAINGSTAVVGAPFHTVGSNQDQGAAYVFVKSGGTWTQQAELTASDGAAGDEFGTSIAVSGRTIVGGAPRHVVGSNPNQGAAYVFDIPRRSACGDLKEYDSQGWGTISL